MLHVTNGNQKIGEMANLSFPPIETCRPDPPCADVCYAHRIYQARPAVRKAWDENYDEYKEDPVFFWMQLQKIVSELVVERFRLFVGGDFPRPEMVTEYIQFAELNRHWKFLVYTKRHEWLPPLEALPTNLSMLVSMWDGLEVSGNAVDYPKAWFRDSKHALFVDDRIPKDAIICAATCSGCGYKCLDMRQKGKDVVLKYHGAGADKYADY